MNQYEAITLADPENSDKGGGGPENIFISPTYFKERRTNLPLEAIEPKGSVQVFLRKPIATCGFPGED